MLEASGVRSKTFTLNAVDVAEREENRDDVSLSRLGRQ